MKPEQGSSESLDVLRGGAACWLVEHTRNLYFLLDHLETRAKESKLGDIQTLWDCGRLWKKSCQAGIAKRSARAKISSWKEP